MPAQLLADPFEITRAESENWPGWHPMVGSHDSLADLTDAARPTSRAIIEIIDEAIRN